MSLEFFDLNLVISQLKADVAVLNNSVQGSVSFQAAVSSGVIKRHTAFVLPGSDNARPNGFAGTAIDQRINTTFGVLFAVRNVADTTGSAGNTALKALRDAVVTSLMGWVPSASFGAVNYAGGRLQGFNNGVLWYQDNYVTGFNLRKM